MTGATLAAAAGELIGCPFRLHGRDPSTGLDCIGVLSVSLERIGRRSTLPRAYTLRNSQFPDFMGYANSSGLESAEGSLAAGDVLLARVSPVQFHLIIMAAVDRVIHAHAGVRRVVAEPLPKAWQIIAHLRLSEPDRN